MTATLRAEFSRIHISIYLYKCGTVIHGHHHKFGISACQEPQPAQVHSLGTSRELLPAAHCPAPTETQPKLGVDKSSSACPSFSGLTFPPALLRKVYSSVPPNLPVHFVPRSLGCTQEIFTRARGKILK